MPHPYMIRRAEISGFFGFLCLIVGYATLTSEPTVVRVRLRLIHTEDVAVLHTAGVALLIAAVLLLAFAVYSQWRFGPSMSSVPGPKTIWPPRGFRAWFGAVLFVLVLLLMAAIIFVHVVFTFIKT